MTNPHSHITIGKQVAELRAIIAALAQQIVEQQARIEELYELADELLTDADPESHGISSCNCEPETGYVCVVCGFANSKLNLKARKVFNRLTSSEALAAHDAKKRKEVLEDRADNLHCRIMIGGFDRNATAMETLMVLEAEFRKMAQEGE